MLSNWEQEIIDNNGQRVVALLSKEIEFEKSIADDFDYTNKPDSGGLIVKTGKEIKEKLQGELQCIAKRLGELQAQMAILVSQIGTLPIGIKDSYNIERYRGLLPNIPMVYSCDQIYNKDASESEGPSEYFQEESLPTQDSTLKEKMRGYNKLTDKYVCDSVDELRLNTLIRNLNDNQSVKLTLDLATKLGF